MVLLPSTEASGVLSISELTIVAFPAGDILLVGVLAAMLLRARGTCAENSRSSQSV